MFTCVSLACSHRSLKACSQARAGHMNPISVYNRNTGDRVIDGLAGEIDPWKVCTAIWISALVVREIITGASRDHLPVIITLQNSKN